MVELAGFGSDNRIVDPAVAANLTTFELHIIDTIDHNEDELTLPDLCERLDGDEPAVLAALSSLEQKGFIKFETKKIVVPILTEAGLSVYAPAAGDEPIEEPDDSNATGWRL